MKYILAPEICANTRTDEVAY